MELVHVERKGKITFRLMIEQDDTPVRGNAIASGDNEEDTRVENEILERLRNGDTWAWASTKCTATVDGLDEVEGVDYLGGCSYRDTKDFIQPGGYWDDMKAAALADLRGQLERAVNALKAVEEGGR